MKKKVSIFPSLRCEVCGHVNLLAFWPIKKYALLLNVICESCKMYAFWSHYYKSEQELMLSSSTWDKRYLKDFVDYKQIYNRGRKKPTSKSI